jgi:hypothetical protein
MLNNNARRESMLGARKQGVIKIADVEYRVVWNEVAPGWDVLRNGAATNISARKKKTSATASAIRDAKAERETAQVGIVVTCLQGRKLETLWKAP